MKITLQLPPDLERQLLNFVDRSQQTPEALIVQTLRQHLPLFPASVVMQPEWYFRTDCPNNSSFRDWRPLLCITTPASMGWPQVVLDYAGDREFPAFESVRDELLPPSEPDFF